MSVLETYRKMTSREQTAYDLGFHEGWNAAIVHARWEHIADYGDGNCYGFCSHCSTEHHAQSASALKAFHRYCRWCGAKMDGDGNGNS